MQLDGGCVHHDDAVTDAGHQTAGVGSLVAAVSDDLAIGEAVRRVEDQCVFALIEINIINKSIQRDQDARLLDQRVRVRVPIRQRTCEIDLGAESDRVAVGVHVFVAVEHHAPAAADVEPIGAAVPHRQLGLELDVEFVHHHHGVLRTVAQAAGVADQIGVVGDDVAVIEGMTGLQLDGVGVHHDDAVSSPRLEIGGRGRLVTVIGGDVALGEPVRRGEGQRVRAGIERDRGRCSTRNQYDLGTLVGGEGVRSGGPIRRREIDCGSRHDGIGGGVHRHVTIEGDRVAAFDRQRIDSAAPGVRVVQIDHLIGRSQVGEAPRAVDDQRVRR